MNVCETSIRDLESPYWGDDVLEDLGTLAADALPCPVCDIGSDVWPYEFGCDRLDRSLDSRVAQTVYDLEDPFSPCLWYERACWAVTDIDNNASVSDVDLLEIQPCSCFPGYLLE